MTLKIITQPQLEKLYQQHILWLKYEDQENPPKVRGKKMDLSNHDLSFLDFRSKAFVKVSFSGSLMNRVGMKDTVFLECTFDGATLKNMTPTCCGYTKCTFDGTGLINVDLTKSSFEDCIMKGVEADEDTKSKVGSWNADILFYNSEVEGTFIEDLVNEQRALVKERISAMDTSFRQIVTHSLYGLSILGILTVALTISLAIIHLF